MSDRGLEAAWRTLLADRRTALIPYLTAGYPDRAGCLEAMRAVERAGADMLELGMPFSDPLADGPVIQASTERALEAGMDVGGMFGLVREAALDIPVVAFGYLNPVLQFGASAFLVEAKKAGVAGLLLTDLPRGEDPDLEARVASPDMPLIPLVAPTTSDDRLATALAGARGFVYVIARMGVTGARTAVDEDVGRLVSRVRAHTDLPVALGFGIGDAGQAAAAAQVADGIVVGSALIRALDDGVGAAETLVRDLRNAIDEGAGTL